ncbi:MAG TPA: hypothetical protein VG165_08980 [Solirubrobacteraceae bacterium]|nr:hypothetical protein [Solirubrobacteraceae bacterium]
MEETAEMTYRQITTDGCRAGAASVHGSSPAGWQANPPAPPETRRRSRSAGAVIGRRHAAAILVGLTLGAVAAPATALSAPATALSAPATALSAPATALAGLPLAQATTPGNGSLEAAASRAGDTGRKIGLSLIGLALSVAAVILLFKRDFKEAVGVIAIGIVAVLLVSPAGINMLQSTVSLLFGS